VFILNKAFNNVKNNCNIITYVLFLFQSKLINLKPPQCENGAQYHLSV